MRAAPGRISAWWPPLRAKDLPSITLEVSWYSECVVVTRNVLHSCLKRFMLLILVLTLQHLCSVFGKQWRQYALLQRLFKKCRQFNTVAMLSENANSTAFLQWCSKILLFLLYSGFCCAGECQTAGGSLFSFFSFFSRGFAELQCTVVWGMFFHSFPSFLAVFAELRCAVF